MHVFLSVLGYLSIPLIVAGTCIMVRGLRKTNVLKPGMLVYTMAVALLILIVYVVALRVAPHGALSWPLLFLGLGLGAWSSWATRLEAAEDRILARRSLWYVAVWGGTLAFTQLLAVTAGPQAVAWGVASVYFSTGLTLGTNVTLLVRRHGLLDQARRHLAAASVSVGESGPGAAASGACAACGGDIGADMVFCPRCGTRVKA